VKPIGSGAYGVVIAAQDSVSWVRLVASFLRRGGAWGMKANVTDGPIDSKAYTWTNAMQKLL